MDMLINFWMVRNITQECGELNSIFFKYQFLQIAFRFISFDHIKMKLFL